METFFVQLNTCHKYIKITCSLWLIKDDLSTCSLAQIAAVITLQFYLVGSMYELRPKLTDIPNLPPYTGRKEHSCSIFQFEIVWVNYFYCNCPLSQCCLRYSGYVWNVLISDPRLIMQGILKQKCCNHKSSNQRICHQ
jgi:hypothetical protein